MKVIASILLVFLFACKNQKPSASNSGNQESKQEQSSAAQPDTASAQTKNDTARFVALFYSIAEGAEHKLINEFLDSLGSYSLRISKNIDFFKTSWGREGETDICFPLNELTPSEQVEFVAWARGILKKGKWVNMYENFPCPKRPKR